MITDRTNHALIVQGYCDEVLSGQVLTGRLERLAVERHLHDLEHAHTRGWRFDEAKAERACAFYPKLLRHPVGRWYGEPFFLDPWQAFCIWVLHGWRSADTGLRRFTKAHWSVARKNGKTTLAAGEVCHISFAEDPPDPSAELYCIAPKLDQSLICMRTAARMVQLSPALKKRANVLSQAFHNTETDGVVKALGVGPSHGYNPSLVVIDEEHEFTEAHRGFYTAMTTGGAAREQPLELVITTSGSPGGESPIWEEEDAFCVQVLESAQGTDPISDRLFPFICRYDADDDWRDPANFRKANPNLGVSVSEAYLMEKLNEARHKPSAKNTFMRFHANRPHGSREKAIEWEQWEANTCTNVEELELTECWGGLDLGSNYDWASFALLFPFEAGKYLLRCWSWCCLDGELDIDREPFTEWISSGHLLANPGDSVSFQRIEEDIRRILEPLNCLGIVFDPMSAKLMAERLSDQVQMMEMVQSYAKYNEPCTQFITRVPQGDIIHDGNPCTAWQADNLVIKRNGQQQWMPDKSHPTRKVDAMAATLMGFSACLFAEVERLDYYESNPLEFI